MLGDRNLTLKLYAGLMIGSIALCQPCLAADPAGSDVSWGGAYLGVQAGWSGIDASEVNDFYDDGEDVYSSSTDFSGVFGGAYLGYNLPLASGLVIGAELDVNIGSLSEDDVPVTWNGEEDETTDEYQINAFGAGRVRLAYAAGHFMPFLAGGIALANFDVGYADGEDEITASDWAVGYTLGGGVEYAVGTNIRLRAEYRYTNYGTTDVTIDPLLDDVDTTVFETDLSSQNLLLGIAYAF